MATLNIELFVILETLYTCTPCNGRKFSDLYSGMHLYMKRPKFFEAKKVHFELTFGACAIASVSYTSACTTMRGNTVSWSFLSPWDYPPPPPLLHSIFYKKFAVRNRELRRGKGKLKNTGKQEYLLLAYI